MVIRVVAGPMYKTIGYLLWILASEKPHPMRGNKTRKTHNFINFAASAAAAAEPGVILTFPVTHFADRRLSLPKLHRPTVMTVQWATE